MRRDSKPGNSAWRGESRARKSPPVVPWRLSKAVRSRACQSAARSKVSRREKLWSQVETVPYSPIFVNGPGGHFFPPDLEGRATASTHLDANTWHDGSPSADFGRRAGMARPPAVGSLVKVGWFGWASRRLGAGGLVGQQSGDQPQVVTEDAPGHREVTVVKSLDSQALAEALLKDGNTPFGRGPATL